MRSEARSGRENVARAPLRAALLPLCIAILAEVGASLALQAAVDQTWWYAAVAVGYGIGFVLMVRILRLGVAVGVVYGIWGASGVALTAAIAAVLFGQRLSPANVVGLVLIMVGVLVVQAAPVGRS